MALETLIPPGARIRERKIWIKLVIIFIALLAIIITATVIAHCETTDDNGENKVFHYYEFASDQFFIGLCVLITLFEVILFFGYMYAMELLEAITFVNFFLLELCASAFWATLMFIASCVFINEVNYIDGQFHKAVGPTGLVGSCNFDAWRFTGVLGLFLGVLYGYKSKLVYDDLKKSGFMDGGYIPIGEGSEYRGVPTEDAREVSEELTVSV